MPSFNAKGKQRMALGPAAVALHTCIRPRDQSTLRASCDLCNILLHQPLPPLRDDYSPSPRTVSAGRPWTESAHNSSFGNPKKGELIARG